MSYDVGKKQGCAGICMLGAARIKFFFCQQLLQTIQ